MNAQLKQIYRGKAEKNGSLIVNEMSVQQQENFYDCGLFAIAFAFHLAQGDEPSALNFDCKKLRQHLVECFEKEILSPFPMLVTRPSCCAKQIRNIIINNYLYQINLNLRTLTLLAVAFDNITCISKN